LEKGGGLKGSGKTLVFGGAALPQATEKLRNGRLGFEGTRLSAAPSFAFDDLRHG
jgi:hypothetical protein